MILLKKLSECGRNDKIIVSKDKGNSREHRAINEKGKFDVRHYQLDGKLVKQEKCCDFLLVNDSTLKAYFIELKGVNLDEAIPQLEAAAKKFKEELKGYNFHYRIVASKITTQKVESSKIRRFKQKYGNLLYKSQKFEEKLD